VIKPGPNNPVGAVWIDLNAPSYGLHGTPDPDKIGKTASHGCVRMTNWDANALAAGVLPGILVHFMGSVKRAEAAQAKRFFSVTSICTTLPS
jgi:lipoprotein-anchoring transpeptidase ErfK/SrfK